MEDEVVVAFRVPLEEGVVGAPDRVHLNPESRLLEGTNDRGERGLLGRNPVVLDEYVGDLPECLCAGRNDGALGALDIHLYEVVGLFAKKLRGVDRLNLDGVGPRWAGRAGVPWIRSRGPPPVGAV